jgi:methyl-accepting chemotaxis protein/hemerythrin
MARSNPHGAYEAYDDYALLFETLDKLQAAVIEDRQQPTAGLLLHEVANYTCHHLASEEAIFAAAGLPGLAERTAEDREITRQVAEYITLYETGKLSISIEFLDGLRNWLRAHIESTDRAYRPWLARQKES